MGLLIKLENGNTKLKSLKFGKDRPGGGDSGQPYIKKPISNQPLSFLDGDGLIRGGLRAPLRALDDSARLSKYFFDFKNPSGLIFTAKQNLLSRIGTKTEVAQDDPTGKVYSPNSAYGKGTINEGIYTPASTILQAASNFVGGHLNKQGIDPTGIKENLSITPYSKVSSLLNQSKNNTFKVSEGSFSSKFSNRLLNFWGKKQVNTLIGGFSSELPSPILYSYDGGAGSTLGIGTTYINYATMPDGITPLRTGVNNNQFRNEETANEFINGKTLPSDKTYINYVDGVPVISNSLDYNRFTPISIYGGDGETPYIINPTQDAGIGFNSYQSLFNRVKNKVSWEGVSYSSKPKYTHREKELFQSPIKASHAYNLAISAKLQKDNVNYKIDFEKIKESKIQNLQKRITNIEDSKNNPFIGKKIKLKNYTPSQNFQSAINNSSGIQKTVLQNQLNTLSSVQIVNFEEYNELEKATTVAKLDININKLKEEISILQASQFDINNIDGPLPILSSGLGNPRTILERGDSHFFFGQENKSVFEKGINGTPTLIERTDAEYQNLTPTLKEIVANRFTGRGSYTANTTDARFPKIVLENRVHTGDPGSMNGNRRRALDKINAKAPYTGTTGKGDYQYKKNANDFAHFRIGILDPFIPKNATYLNFRALIEDVSDNYSAEWSAQKYIGRAEKLYKYGGFDRKMSLSFKVVVMSQAEMPAIYSKLNYLASSLAPAYSAQGYMAGNIALLTLGEYVYEQYGIITSLNYKIPPESSWELIIGEGKGLDELPFMIDVSMNFTPIHGFRPEVGNHNRYITHNMPLPYTGKPLKNIRDSEIPDIPEPLPTPSPTPTPKKPWFPPLPTSTPLPSVPQFSNGSFGQDQALINSNAQVTSMLINNESTPRPTNIYAAGSGFDLGFDQSIQNNSDRFSELNDSKGLFKPLNTRY